MANFTVREGNYTGEMNQTTTTTWPVGVPIFVSALNIFLSITATLGNALIVVALHRDSSLYPPTKLLFRCLAVTDLCVGLITQPLFVTFIFALFSRKAIRWNVFYYVNDGINVSSMVLCGMSILTSAAISVDRLLVLLLGLGYRHVVTLRRTRAVIVCFFVLVVSGGAMYFWNYDIFWIAMNVLGLLSLIVSILSYTKIHLKLRQHQARVQGHVHQGQPNGGGIPLNIARYKKTVSSIAWVQLALVACYFPFLITSTLKGVMATGSDLSYLVWLAAITLVYLNSSLNPILYCWKIKGVRHAAKETIRQFCCFCS